MRLEQRMGRIHRIGQESTCVIFNFCAENTVEGKLLTRLLEKLEEMRSALGGRVYDVVGDLLARNGVDFERLLRETLLNPTQMNPAQLEIEGLSAEVYKEYEEMIGVAQATKNVDMSWVRERDWRSEERRLMPEYVEQFFGRACEQLAVKLDRRGDGLWRIEHVPQSLRSPEQLRSVKRLGRPQPTYRKLTFLKEERAKAQHEDAVLLSPGHPLYAATVESLLRKLGGTEQATAPFIAPWATQPYRIDFFTYHVTGLSMAGGTEEVYAELVAVTDGADGFELVPADVLHDLTAVDFAPRDLEAPGPEDVKRASDFVRLKVQHPVVQDKRGERLAQAQLRSSYLAESMDAQYARLEEKWSELDDRVYRGEEAARLALERAEARVNDLDRRKSEKLAGFEQLGIVKPGPVIYLGTALIGPPPLDDPAVDAMRNDPAVEQAAMDWAMAAEREAGWDPEDVSAARDGSGFDIRSVTRGPDGRVVEVRRIEVKGRAPAQGDVSLCRTEWIAAHRHGDSFWLYVLYGAKSDQPRGIKIQNPAEALKDQVRKVTTVTAFHIPGAAIEAAAP